MLQMQCQEYCVIDMRKHFCCFFLLSKEYQIISNICEKNFKVEVGKYIYEIKNAPFRLYNNNFNPDFEFF